MDHRICAAISLYGRVIRFGVANNGIEGRMKE